jgi:hypothetical protein
MYDITIIGFGLSTLCLLIYLFNENFIKQFNILVIEKNDYPCKYSLKYENINSNSTLNSLISVFRNSIFDDILGEVDSKYDLDKFISLKDYNNIIVKISKKFVNELKKYKNITLKFNTKADNISYDKVIKVNNSISKTCIISMGAKQDIDYIKYKDVNNILKKNQNKIVLPHDIFTKEYDLNKLENKNIAIIGSSHSSISIIDSLNANTINYKDITLLCRNDFKIFFKNCEECTKNGYIFEKEDICSETQMINRFDGLRENSKEIYMNLNKYNINKIVTKKIFCDDYDIIIPCWGYYKIIPKINNVLYTENIDSNKNFELKIKNKEYNNIFLLGISSYPKIEVTQKSFKKSIDGVWLYYNIISKELYKILDSRIN